MQDIIEIRWHGRGGQGAKTAALLFADAAISEGKYIQAFPEYGPERMGAPVQAFDRLSDKPISVHAAITSPDIVVVLDSTLMKTIDVTQGLPADGKLIVNTQWAPKELRGKFNIQGGKIYTVDASRIALETIRLNIPNTPMLGALVKVSGLLKLEKMLEDMQEKLEAKFRHKPEVIQGNLKAIKRAYQEVKGEE